MGHIDRATSMAIIKGDLSSAIGYGLELEVITEALIAMKEDPTLSPEEAFARGCSEWDVYAKDFEQYIEDLKEEDENS